MCLFYFLTVVYLQEEIGWSKQGCSAGVAAAVDQPETPSSSLELISHICIVEATAKGLKESSL